MLEINFNPSRTHLQQFAWMLSAFLGLAGLWWIYRFGAWPAATAVWAVAAAVALVGWLSPAALRFLYVGWLCAAFPIGWVISHLLLAAIFYLIFTPLGWMVRLSGHDLLGLRRDKPAESYWLPRETAKDPQRYFRQF